MPILMTAFLLTNALLTQPQIGPGEPAKVNETRRSPLLQLSPNVDSGEVLRFSKLGWSVKCLAFSPDGRFLAAGKLDETLLVFDLSGKRVVTDTGRIDKLGQVTAVAFSPDGKKLLVGSYGGHVLVWDFQRDGTLGAKKEFGGHAREILSICVSGDSRHVLSGSSEKRARYWELESCRELFAYNEFLGAVNAVYLTRSGRQGLATDGKTLSLLDLKQGGVLQSMALTSSYHAPVAFSRDGRRVAAKDGHKVRLWEIKSGREYAPLEHPLGPRGLAFSRGGRYLLTTNGGQVNVWDTRSGLKRYELDTLQNVLPPNVLAYAPDGRHFAAIPDAAGQTLQIMRLPADAVD